MAQTPFQKKHLPDFVISKLDAAQKEIEAGKLKSFEEAETEIDKWLNKSDELTREQIEELERWLELLEKEDVKMRTWEEVRARLLN